MKNKPIYYTGNFTVEDLKKACAELEKKHEGKSVMDILLATNPTPAFMERLEKACKDYIRSGSKR